MWNHFSVSLKSEIPQKRNFVLWMKKMQIIWHENVSFWLESKIGDRKSIENQPFCLYSYNVAITEQKNSSLCVDNSIQCGAGISQTQNHIPEFTCQKPNRLKWKNSILITCKIGKSKNCALTVWHEWKWHLLLALRRY